MVRPLTATTSVASKRTTPLTKPLRAKLRQRPRSAASTHASASPNATLKARSRKSRTVPGIETWLVARKTSATAAPISGALGTRRTAGAAPPNTRSRWTPT